MHDAPRLLILHDFASNTYIPPAAYIILLWSKTFDPSLLTNSIGDSAIIESVHILMEFIA